MPKYYRTIVRRRNEEGKFKWMHIELEEMAHQYGVEIEKLYDQFGQVNCDIKLLREKMEGKNLCTWTSLEDLTLK